MQLDSLTLYPYQVSLVSEITVDLHITECEYGNSPNKSMAFYSLDRISIRSNYMTNIQEHNSTHSKCFTNYRPPYI